MSVFDQGGSYRLGYLGSVMVTHASTGLGMLQKPLRELYFKHRQSNQPGQERHLVITAKGMLIAHQQSPAVMPEETFYPMNNIVFWDAVQFVTVKGRDKKHKGAFEPLDLDHSRNKDNLFSVIEKKYHFLVKQTHPPLFTCALRRTEGVKSIDVHVFVCLAVDEALSIVHGLNDLQHYINSDAERSALFDYNHYPRSVSSRSHENSPDSTFAPGQQYGAPRSYAPSDRGSHFGDAGVHFGDRGSQYGDQGPVSPISPSKPRFGVPAIGPQSGGSALNFGGPRPPPKPFHQHDLPPAPSHPAPTRPQSYNLTQDDFQSPQRHLGYNDEQIQQRGYPPHHQNPNREHNKFDISGNNTYEYIRHIEKEEVPSRPTRLPRTDQETTAGSVYTTTLATRPQPALHPDYREDYNSMSRDMYVADSTIQHGYSSNNAHGNSQYDDNYMHSIRGEKNRFDEIPLRPQLPERSAPHHSGERTSAERSRVYNSQLPERELLREYTQNQRQTGNTGYNQRPVSIDYTPNQPRPLSQISEQSSKPVAMVQPRKVQGVKVLPNVPLSPRNNEPSSYDDGPKRNSQLSVETDSRHSSGPSSPGMNYSNYYDNREIKKDGAKKKNWQFGANDTSAPVGTLKQPDDADQFKTTDEQRHLRMKKEAELANVFQEMQIDDKTYRMSDFEKGLGYLP